MSGNYKPRDKTENEIIYDSKELNESVHNCLNSLKEFFDEYSLHEGRAYYDTWAKSMDAVFDLQWNERIKNDTKVGEIAAPDITHKGRYDDI